MTLRGTAARNKHVIDSLFAACRASGARSGGWRDHDGALAAGRRAADLHRHLLADHVRNANRDLFTDQLAGQAGTLDFLLLNHLLNGRVGHFFQNLDGHKLWAAAGAAGAIGAIGDRTTSFDRWARWASARRRELIHRVAATAIGRDLFILDHGNFNGVRHITILDVIDRHATIFVDGLLDGFHDRARRRRDARAAAGPQAASGNSAIRCLRSVRR